MLSTSPCCLKCSCSCSCKASGAPGALQSVQLHVNTLGGQKNESGFPVCQMWLSKTPNMINEMCMASGGALEELSKIDKAWAGPAVTVRHLGAGAEWHQPWCCSGCPEKAGGGSLAGLQHHQNRELMGDSSKTSKTRECGDKPAPLGAVPSCRARLMFDRRSKSCC